MPEQEGRVLALVGPTAAGKSAVAIEVARRMGAEIVSIDSASVYRGMDIGTDKPSPEDMKAAPHHMVDVVEPDETLSVAEFQRMARGAVNEILARGRVPLLVGGSGLYFRAVVDPLEFPGTDPAVRSRLEEEDAGTGDLYERLERQDPEAAARIAPQNQRRIVRALEVIEVTGRKFSSFRAGWDDYESIYDLAVAALESPRDELNRRIDRRVDLYLARGLVEEVKELEARGLRRSLTSVQALGYSQILEYLDGKVSLDEAVERVKQRTRRFARRQLTWFKADPRVRWFEDPAAAAAFLKSAGETA